jgi:hypothetical protein
MGKTNHERKQAATPNFVNWSGFRENGKETLRTLDQSVKLEQS